MGGDDVSSLDAEGEAEICPAVEARLRHWWLAFGGPPRRHGCTQREKLVRLGPGRGPGTDFEPILARPSDPGDGKIAAGGFSTFSASGGPRPAPGPSKNDSG